MTETDIECEHTKTTLHARGVNRSHKIITFSHLNSTNINVNFMRENVESISVVSQKYKNTRRINPIICIICVFSSSLRLGALSNCCLLTSFISLLITSLVCNAASKLNLTVHKNRSYNQLTTKIVNKTYWFQNSGGVLWKKVFLKILQYLQENTCARVSF